MRIVLVALLLAGCATPEQRAARLSSPTLCYVNYAGNLNDKQVTSRELSARGFTCDAQAVQMGAQEWTRLQAERQNQADRELAAAAILLGNARQPPSINCVTSRSGPYSYTNCQ